MCNSCIVGTQVLLIIIIVVILNHIILQNVLLNVPGNNGK